MTLHECARRMGVETHSKRWEAMVGEIVEPRPDLEIAHDLLAKLRGQFAANDYGCSYRIDIDSLEPNFHWRLWDGEGAQEGNTGTFIEAVTALCERSSP